MQNDSAVKTLFVAGVLCVVCSVLVSTAAVKLKPQQDLNKKLDIKKNLLLSAGLLKSPKATKEEIEEKFSVIETKVVDVETGEFTTAVDPANYDQKEAAASPKMNFQIPSNVDFARIKQRAKYAKVYFVKEGSSIKNIVLPVHGKGLWSTMYGFLVLKPDTTTVAGIGFYQHGETPGLGGEIDNPNWQNSWVGKKIYGESMSEVMLKVIKGQVDTSAPKAEYKIDGLAGATLTANGVSGMLKYWLGKSGFGPFLKKFREANGKKLVSQF